MPTTNPHGFWRCPNPYGRCVNTWNFVHETSCPSCGAGYDETIRDYHSSNETQSPPVDNYRNVSDTDNTYGIDNVGNETPSPLNEVTGERTEAVNLASVYYGVTDKAHGINTVKNRGSPTKGDNVSTTPTSILRPGPPAIRRGHAHRRSVAMSSDAHVESDLSGPGPFQDTPPNDTVGFKPTMEIESSSAMLEDIRWNTAQSPEFCPGEFDLERDVFENETILDDEDEDSSVASTAPVSLSTFAESVETGATALSRGSQFTVEQIQSATRIFISILQEDQLLIPLYESARNDTRIGPNRLRRHIHKSLKAFAEQLKGEANDQFQFAACLLVQAKANYAARCISGGEDIYHHPPASGHQRDQESKDLVDSSEEETIERSDGISELGNLRTFYLFLGNSDAYATLQARIHAFCTKEFKASSYRPITVELDWTPPTTGNSRRTWYTWQKDAQIQAYGFLTVVVLAAMGVLGAPKKRYSLAPGFDRVRLARAALFVALFLLIDVVFPLTDDPFMALGFLEPPLRVGWTRIRSECVSLLQRCQCNGTPLTVTTGMWRSVLRRCQGVEEWWRGGAGTRDEEIINRCQDHSHSIPPRHHRTKIYRQSFNMVTTCQ